MVRIAELFLFLYAFYRFRGWHKVKTKPGDHFILTAPPFPSSYKGICHSTLARKADEEVKRVKGKFAHRYTRKSQISKTSKDAAGRPFTAPAAMQRGQTEKDGSMEDIGADVDLQAGNTGRGPSVEDFHTPTDSSHTADTGYGSNEERLVDGATPTLKGISGPHSDTDSAYGSKSPLSTMRSSPMGSSPMGSVTPYEIRSAKDQPYSNDNITLHEKIFQSENDRSKSHEVEDDVDEEAERLSETSIGEKIVQMSRPHSQNKYEIIRRKAAKPKEIISVDNAPVPQMTHSKPKVVAVGGIGKISLLEDISESQYWEELGDQDLSSDSEEEDECFIEDADDIEIEINTSYEPRSKSEASIDPSALEERKENLRLLRTRLNGGDDEKSTPRTDTSGKSKSSPRNVTSEYSPLSDITQQMKKEKEMLQKKRHLAKSSVNAGGSVLTPRKDRRSSSKSSSDSDRKEVKIIDSSESTRKKPNVSYFTTQIAGTFGKQSNKQRKTNKNNAKFGRLVKRMEGDISDYMAKRLLSGQA